MCILLKGGGVFLTKLVFSFLQKYYLYVVLVCTFVETRFYNDTLHESAIKHKFFALSKSEPVKFSLIESVICLFTDSSAKKYFSLLNLLIFTDESVKKIFVTVKSVNFHWNNQWNLTVYSNLFLAIWISQILLIISRFWLIQI